MHGAAAEAAGIKTKFIKTEPQKAAGKNLFCFLVQSVLFAVPAIFIHFQSFLQGLLILVRKIIYGLTLGAFELDHVVLGHSKEKRAERDSLKS